MASELRPGSSEIFIQHNVSVSSTWKHDVAPEKLALHGRGWVHCDDDLVCTAKSMGCASLVTSMLTLNV